MSGLRVVEVLEAATRRRRQGGRSCSGGPRAGAWRAGRRHDAEGSRRLSADQVVKSTMSPVQRSFFFSAAERYASLLLFLSRRRCSPGCCHRRNSEPMPVRQRDHFSDRGSFQEFGGANYLIQQYVAPTVRIAEDPGELQSARAGIDVAVLEERFPAKRILRAVGQNELEHPLRMGAVGLTPDLTAVLRPLQVLLLARAEIHLDRVDLRHGRHQGLGADEVPHLRLRDPRDPVDRRYDPAQSRESCARSTLARAASTFACACRCAEIALSSSC